MRGLRILTGSLLLLFGALSVAHSQPEQIYTSNHGGWGAVLGSCQLRVREEGSSLVFTPVGHSSLEFEARVADLKPGQSVTLVQSVTRGANNVRETLTVNFGKRGDALAPVGYTLVREYSNMPGRVYLPCTDLQADSI